MASTKSTPLEHLQAPPPHASTGMAGDGAARDASELISIQETLDSLAGDDAEPPPTVQPQYVPQQPQYVPPPPQVRMPHLHPVPVFSQMHVFAPPEVPVPDVPPPSILDVVWRNVCEIKDARLAAFVAVLVAVLSVVPVHAYLGVLLPSDVVHNAYFPLAARGVVAAVCVLVFRNWY